jgi:hypothetical protein
MNPITALLVDDAPERISALVVPPMGLSSSRSEMRKHSFVLEMSAAGFVEVLAPLYDAWVAESKRDDEQCGGPQDVLAMAGYPSPSELLGFPKLLQTVIGSYLLQEFLGELLGDGAGDVQFWLDEVTGCHSEGGVVCVSGACFGRQ